jgi:hypothetical protein
MSERETEDTETNSDSLSSEEEQNTMSPRRMAQKIRKEGDQVTSLCIFNRLLKDAELFERITPIFKFVDELLKVPLPHFSIH